MGEWEKTENTETFSNFPGEKMNWFIGRRDL